jgi:hypothetical protein
VSLPSGRLAQHSLKLADRLLQSPNLRATDDVIVRPDRFVAAFGPARRPGHHAAGNYRIFIAMAGELLMSAAQREITALDEKLYLQVFARPDTPAARRSAARS